MSQIISNFKLYSFLHADKNTYTPTRPHARIYMHTHGYINMHMHTQIHTSGKFYAGLATRSSPYVFSLTIKMYNNVEIRSPLSSLNVGHIDLFFSSSFPTTV